MYPFLRVTTLTMALLVLTACTAWGQRTPIKKRTPAPRTTTITAGAVTSTNLSGYAGDDQTLREPGNDAFLWGIDFEETGDEPCYLRLHWWRANVSDRRQGEFETRFDVCDGNVGYTKKLRIPNAYTSEVEGLRAAHALKVCTNKKRNHRLKGATLYGSYIDRNDDGQVERDPALRQSFERPNCAEWHAKRSCPKGEVAVGVIIEHNDDEIVGLGLKCAAPSVSRGFRVRQKN